MTDPRDTSIEQSGILYVPDPKLGDTQEIDLDGLAAAIAMNEGCDLEAARKMIALGPMELREAIFGRPVLRALLPPLSALPVRRVVSGGRIDFVSQERFEFWHEVKVGSHWTGRSFHGSLDFFRPYSGDRTPQRWHPPRMCPEWCSARIDRISIVAKGPDGDTVRLRDGFVIARKRDMPRWCRPLDRFVNVFDGDGSLYEQASPVDVTDGAFLFQAGDPFNAEVHLSNVVAPLRVLREKLDPLCESLLLHSPPPFSSGLLSIRTRPAACFASV